MSDDLLFFKHAWWEQGDGDSSSKCNPKEAEMVLAFAKYLLKAKMR